PDRQRPALQLPAARPEGRDGNLAPRPIYPAGHGGRVRDAGAGGGDLKSAISQKPNAKREHLKRAISQKPNGKREHLKSAISQKPKGTSEVRGQRDRGHCQMISVNTTGWSIPRDCPSLLAFGFWLLAIPGALP